MATIAEQLTSLANTKTAIKDAIVAKGVAVADTDPFSAYPAKIGQISGGAPATKFGASIDNFLGSVDADGNYVKPTEPPEIVFTGVTRATTSGGCTNLLKNIDGSIIFPDLVYVENLAFVGAFEYITGSLSITFSVLEEINANQVFEDALKSPAGYPHPRVYFLKLKKISGNRVFETLLNIGSAQSVQSFDSAFPVLEEVSGNQVFAQTLGTSNEKVIASSIKKIIGGDSATNATFTTGYTSSGVVLYLPSATNVSGYIIKGYSTKSGELHFAAANQAAIEACDGYSYMFGATAIYFDLITTITVDGVVYSRGLTIDGYTAWDDGANVIYTDATAEPAVGTVVYSDQGTTQVGTVSAVV